MSGDMTIGLVILAGALLSVTVLVLWSRAIIERIRRRGTGSAREIFHDSE